VRVGGYKLYGGDFAAKRWGVWAMVHPEYYSDPEQGGGDFALILLDRPILNTPLINLPPSEWLLRQLSSERAVGEALGWSQQAGRQTCGRGCSSWLASGRAGSG